MSELVVRTPFLTYHTGDIITDPQTVSDILANPDYAPLVVQSGTPTGGGSGSSSPGPTVLISNNGNVTVDGTTLQITSGNILQLVPQTTNSASLIATLGYTPVNAATVGVNNGLASLDSSGKLPLSQLTASVVGSLNYTGTWNAVLNSPPILSGVGNKGVYYTVSVAGNTLIDGISDWNVNDVIAYNGTVWQKIGSSGNDVVSFNTRSGVITLNMTDVQGALGYTPYNSSNPKGYLTVSDLAANSPVASFNARTGAIVLTSADISTALTFTPYSSTNPSGYVNAAGALAASPVKSFNTRVGQIVLTSADVTAALTYTPYPSTNPNNYITASQVNPSVTSVAGKTGAVLLTASDVSGLAKVATTGSYADITNRPVVATATSQLTNDAGFVTAGTAPVTSVNAQIGNVVLTTSQLTNDAGFITALNAPVRSVNGLNGDIQLPQQTGTLVPLAVSSLTNDLNYISSNFLSTLNIGACLVTVNTVTQSLAQWLSQMIQSAGTILNSTGGNILLSDGSTLGF